MTAANTRFRLPASRLIHTRTNLLKTDAELIGRKTSKLRVNPDFKMRVIAVRNSSYVFFNVVKRIEYSNALHCAADVSANRKCFDDTKLLVYQ